MILVHYVIEFSAIPLYQGPFATVLMLTSSSFIFLILPPSSTHVNHCSGIKSKGLLW